MYPDEEHVAHPRLYGAPAYARPPAQVTPTALPLDPDDLPIAVYQTPEERENRRAAHRQPVSRRRAPRSAAPEPARSLRPQPFAGKLLRRASYAAAGRRVGRRRRTPGSGARGLLRLLRLGGSLRRLVAHLICPPTTSGFDTPGVTAPCTGQRTAIPLSRIGRIQTGWAEPRFGYQWSKGGRYVPDLRLHGRSQGDG